MDDATAGREGSSQLSPFDARMIEDNIVMSGLEPTWHSSPDIPVIDRKVEPLTEEPSNESGSETGTSATVLSPSELGNSQNESSQTQSVSIDVSTSAPDHEKISSNEDDLDCKHSHQESLQTPPLTMHTSVNSSTLGKREAPKDFSPQTQPNKRTKKESSQYDENVEDLSDIGVYSPEYDRAVDVIREVRKTVMRGYEEFEKAGYSTQEADKMRNSFSKITIDTNDIRCQLSIAFMGRMESGKSSLIGSLINFPSLAVALSDGASGTQVIQEFTTMPPIQTETSPFEATVVPLTDLKVDTLIRINLERFYKAHNFLHGDGQYTFDSDEKAAWEDTYENSLKFFAASLLSKKRFDTSVGVEEWLLEAASIDQEVVHHRIFKWMKAEMETQQKATFSAMHPGDLSVQLRNLYRLRHDNDGNIVASPCYLMAKILIKAFGSKLLSCGISCADVPGSDDGDQNRTESVAAYLKEDCYARVIVEPAARIEDNSKFMTLLQQHASEAAEIVIVATKVDQLNIEQCRFRLSESENAELKRLETALQNSERVLYLTQEASRQNPDNVKLAEEAREAKYAVLHRKQQLRDQGVRFACSSIEKILRKRIETRIKDKPIKIFFTDSLSYQQHLTGFDSDHFPALSVGATGIPALRRYLIGLPAIYQKHNCNKTCTLVLPHLLATAQMACRNEIKIRKQEVVNLISRRAEECTRLIMETHNDILKLIKSTVTDTMKSTIPRWKRETDPIIGQWEKLNAATHAACCRREGQWKGSSWNGELLKLISPDVSKGFKELEEGINSLMTKFSADIDTLFPSMKQDLEHCKKLNADDLQAFCSFLTYTQEMLAPEVKNLCEDMISSTEPVKTMLIEEGSSSFLRSLMNKTVYKHCPTKGAGTFIKRKEAIRKGIIGPKGVYSQLPRLANDGLHDRLLPKNWEECHKRIGGFFHDTVEAFRVRFDENISEETADALKHFVLPNLQAAEVMVNGELKDLVRCIAD